MKILNDRHEAIIIIIHFSRLLNYYNHYVHIRHPLLNYYLNFVIIIIIISVVIIIILSYFVLCVCLFPFFHSCSLCNWPLGC
jgi:hypothetical protein